MPAFFGDTKDANRFAYTWRIVPSANFPKFRYGCSLGRLCSCHRLLAMAYHRRIRLRFHSRLNPKVCLSAFCSPQPDPKLQPAQNSCYQEWLLRAVGNGKGIWAGVCLGARCLRQYQSYRYSSAPPSRLSLQATCRIRSSTIEQPRHSHRSFRLTDLFVVSHTLFTWFVSAKLLSNLYTLRFHDSPTAGFGRLRIKHKDKAKNNTSASH